MLGQASPASADDARLPQVLNGSSGFVYYVSITGITGSAAPEKRAGSGGGPGSPETAAGITARIFLLDSMAYSNQQKNQLTMYYL